MSKRHLKHTRLGSLPDRQLRNSYSLKLSHLIGSLPDRQLRNDLITDLASL